MPHIHGVAKRTSYLEIMVCDVIQVLLHSTTSQIQMFGNGHVRHLTTMFRQADAFLFFHMLYYQLITLRFS